MLLCSVVAPQSITTVLTPWTQSIHTRAQSILHTYCQLQYKIAGMQYRKVMTYDHFAYKDMFVRNFKLTVFFNMHAVRTGLRTQTDTAPTQHKTSYTFIFVFLSISISIQWCSNNQDVFLRFCFCICLPFTTGVGLGLGQL
jgi:hypothetical protein